MQHVATEAQREREAVIHQQEKAETSQNMSSLSQLGRRFQQMLSLCLARARCHVHTGYESFLLLQQLCSSHIQW